MGETKLALQVKVEWLESKLAQAEARVLELGAEAAALREALEAVIPYLECGATEGDDAVHLLPMVEAAIAKAKGGDQDDTT